MTALNHKSDLKPHQIWPHELPNALDRISGDARLLSLDCFDTLLWRDCFAPTDVFGDLPGITIGQRAGGEANARKAMRTLKRRGEVNLEDIYSQVMPNASQEELEQAIDAELQAEARACFAFEPTVALMREAKLRGLKVIIVSDTYLSAVQLRDLIEASAGPDVVALIDCIFASSDAGISKGEGLLGKAIKAMKVRGHDVIHIGDNPHADYQSAKALGIPALHLVQFDDRAKQRQRFERTCQQLEPGELGGRDARAIGLQPHRPLLAKYEPQISDPAKALGFTVLGPVFQAYERWLQQEAAALKAARGGEVHWLFMLRDGHLPDVIHSVGERGDSTGRVEISRYVATAASLTTREAYQQHLALEHGLNPSTLARQMLMSEEEIDRLIGNPDTDEAKAKASQNLLSELKRGQRQKITARRARKVAEGLVAHVRAAVDPKPGDTLMLVDLGYNGSAQNAVDALLQEELGVHVAGRYLLCRERAATGLDKTGLIDDRHFDPGLLEAMCANVAVLEQLATCELGSVIGYETDGSPIRKSSSVKGAQSDVRDRVQKGAVAFAKAALNNPVIRLNDAHSNQAWRSCAAQVLTRFLFLPHADELAVLKSFEHDVNLGSERMVALFDPDDAAEQMQRRGLFYMKGSSRMFLPADLAQEDMSTRLALMVQKRFGLGLTYADYSPSSLDMPVMFIGASDHAVRTISARPTHDGYYVARIPLSAQSKAVGVQVGAACSWVEISSITRSRIGSLTGATEDERPTPCQSVSFDALQEHAPGIFKCESEKALVMVMTDADQHDHADSQMIELVFRPIAGRATKTIGAETAHPTNTKVAA